MSKYQSIAEHYARHIRNGKLLAGDKMPSLRSLAEQHNISMTTAVSCYQELASLDYIHARPQAGYYVNTREHALPQPKWRRFTSKVSRHNPQRNGYPARDDGSTILNQDGPLGIARLALDTESIDAINKSARRAVRNNTAVLTRYPLPEGEIALRDTLADHFSAKGFKLDKQELVITHGCMDAIKTALEVCTHSGNTIAVSSPCFSGLLDLLASLSLNIIEIPTLNSGLDLDQFEDLLKQNSIDAGLFCCTHMNPQGITLSVDQKKRLAALAAQYQIPIIEDDVYLELSHQHHMPLPASFYDDSGYMLWCGSVSKTLSPSYRLGWCRPGRYLRAYKHRARSVPTLIQQLLTDFISSGAYAKHLKRANLQLTKNTLAYHSYLAEHLPSPCAVTQPNGGLVLWISIPGLNTQHIQQQAIAHNLDLRWGTQFTLSKRYLDCIRINIGFAVDDAVQRQLDTLLGLIRSALPKSSNA